LRNPITLVDPDGKQVDATYVKTFNYESYIPSSLKRSIIYDYQKELEHRHELQDRANYMEWSGSGNLEATYDEMFGASMVAGSFSLGSALSRSTTIYRTVAFGELESITKLIKYSVIEGLESKYFWTNLKDAEWFAKVMGTSHKEAYWITQAKVRSKLLEKSDVYLVKDVFQKPFYNVGSSTLDKFKRVPHINNLSNLGP
jgi:hypothetical protein